MNNPRSEDGVLPSPSSQREPHLPFFIVGIGASAGGIDALIELFSRMPADPGMAFVIVLHLSPKYESDASAVLQAKTPLRVIQVTQNVNVEKNCIYIISPANDLFINDGCLQAIPSVRPKGRHTAIDLFLRSLAEAHHTRAIGIILSGAGSDGAVGIARIKEKGGVTIAQSPDEAEFADMPRSVIATGMIDMILPIPEMPEKLIALVANAASIRLPLEEGDANLAAATGADEQHNDQENAVRDVLSLLQLRTGHDFKDYKRGTILRRLQRRLQVTGHCTVAQYRDFLEHDPDEPGALLQDLLISVTNFFRDREAFDALEREVIPTLFPLSRAGSLPQDLK